MRRALTLCLFLAALAAMAAGAGWWSMNRMMDAPGERDQSQVLVVEPGASVRRIASQMVDQGIGESPRLFEAYVRLSGQGKRIQAGEYPVAAKDSLRQVLARLVEGRVLLHSVTLVEGWTWWEMLSRLGTLEFLENDLGTLDAKALMERLGRPDVHPEGRFFPDTYFVPRGARLSRVLVNAMTRMDSELVRAWEARGEDLGLDSPDKLLVLASIVEKETALASERPEIAGVFLRRLKRRMRLQTDPTVIYGLGPDFDGNIRRADLERDGPYNTYTRHGLPPTPICMPGREALDAVIGATDSEALYFVATGEDDGSHYFSATLEEHNRAVARYLAKLRQKRREGR